jgi:hypothetical protein
VTEDSWTALMSAKCKLRQLLVIDQQDGPYWQYMSLLAIYNVIGSVLVKLKEKAYVKPEEVKK